MHTFERRKLEVFFAMLTTGFGGWLLFPSQAMTSPGLADVRGIMSEAQRAARPGLAAPEPEA